MTQYNHKYRLYELGSKRASQFDNIMPQRISVRIYPLMWQPHTYTKTPFSPVQLATYRNPPEIRNFFKTLDGQRKRLSLIWNEFKQGIYEHWKPDKIHLVGTSSGYDSRVIAKALKELRNKHGKKWFGDTYFVECGGEKEGFEAIMKKLRFNDYIIWEPDYDFDYFIDHHKKYNGICSFPVNQWYDYFIKNWNEEDIQYITGYGGNVTEAVRIDNNFPHVAKTKRRWTLETRLTTFFKYQYYYQLSAFKEPKDTIYPYLTWRYIRAISGVTNARERMSRTLARTYVGECEAIRRTTIKEVARMGRRTVSPKVLKELYDWYKSTSYGKRNGIDPALIRGKYTHRPGEIEYNQWWLEFCIASYLNEKDNISIR